VFRPGQPQGRRDLPELRQDEFRDPEGLHAGPVQPAASAGRTRRHARPQRRRPADAGVHDARLPEPGQRPVRERQGQDPPAAPGQREPAASQRAGHRHGCAADARHHPHLRGEPADRRQRQADRVAGALHRELRWRGALQRRGGSDPHLGRPGHGGTDGRRRADPRQGRRHRRHPPARDPQVCAGRARAGDEEGRARSAGAVLHHGQPLRPEGEPASTTPTSRWAWRPCWSSWPPTGSTR
jgi:hypothetical protein